MKTKIFVQGIPVIVLLMAFLGAGGIYLSTQSADNLKTLNESKDKNIQTNIEKKIGIPVLMYHMIEKNENIIPYPEAKLGKNMAVTPEEFKEQIQYLKSNGYRTITYEQLNDFMITGTRLKDKSIVISFDDGYYSTYKYAYNILKELEMTAEVAVITGVDCMDNMLGRTTLSKHFNWEQAKEIAQSQVLDLQSHTVTHKNLAEVDEKVLKFELMTSKQSLEDKLHRTITTIIYPSGGYNEKVITEAKRAGYKMGVTTIEGLNYYKDNTMTVKRFTINHQETGESILKRIQSY